MGASRTEAATAIRAASALPSSRFRANQAALSGHRRRASDRAASLAPSRPAGSPIARFQTLAICDEADRQAKCAARAFDDATLARQTRMRLPRPRLGRAPIRISHVRTPGMAMAPEVSASNRCVDIAPSCRSHPAKARHFRQRRVRLAVTAIERDGASLAGDLSRGGLGFLDTRCGLGYLPIVQPPRRTHSEARPAASGAGFFVERASLTRLPAGGFRGRAPGLTAAARAG